MNPGFFFGNKKPAFWLGESLGCEMQCPLKADRSPGWQDHPGGSGDSDGRGVLLALQEVGTFAQLPDGALLEVVGVADSSAHGQLDGEALPFTTGACTQVHLVGCADVADDVRAEHAVADELLDIPEQVAEIQLVELLRAELNRVQIFGAASVVEGVLLRDELHLVGAHGGATTAGVPSEVDAENAGKPSDGHQHAEYVR